MNIKFVLRGFFLALATVLIVAAVGLWVIIGRTPVGRPLDPTPPPPTILAPLGPLPTGVVAFEEWVQHRDEPPGLAGSGFFIRVEDDGADEVVAVMTAHSVWLGDPHRPVESIGLRVAGQENPVAEMDTLYGHPGKALTSDNFVVDYLLLAPNQPIQAESVLIADSRPAPQPGERVALFSGLGDGQGGSRILEGTVQSVDDRVVWVLMDDRFDPSMMSGSPVLSQHTGRVVGMAVAVTPRRTRLLIGIHPIGSLVQRIESATDRFKMSEYQR